MLEREDQNNSPGNCVRAATMTGGIALVVYAATMAPTVAYGGDCGDLISASYRLENSHPTGYPLYLILGRIIALFPLGEVAARYNFLSALSGAATVAVVHLLVQEVTGQWTAGACAGWSLACFYIFWSQSVIAEVYTLSSLLCVAMIYLAYQSVTNEDRRWRFALFLTGGFSLAHHLSSALVFAPSVAWVLLSGRRRSSGWILSGLGGAQGLALSAGLLVAPLLLYSYLPVRSMAQPGGFWGDFRSVEAIWGHVSGRLYRPHLFAVSSAEIWTRISFFAMIVTISLLMGVVPLFIGILTGLRSRTPHVRPLSLLLFLIGLANGLLYFPYEVADWILFFFPTYVGIAIFIGLGADQLLKTAQNAFPVSPISIGLGGLLLVSPVLELQLAWPRANRRAHTLARDDAREVLAEVPAGGRLFVRSDELLFSSWYVQKVLGEFTDREVISHSRYATRNELTRPLLDAIVSSARRGPTRLAFRVERPGPGIWIAERGRTCEVMIGDPPETTQVAAAAFLDVQVRSRAKRGLLLPLRVILGSTGMGMGEKGTDGIDMAFLLVNHGDPGSASPAPPRHMPKVIPAEGGPQLFPQIVGWRTLRKIPAGSEPLRYSVEIPEEASPGTYAVFMRTRPSGTSSAAWRWVAEVEVTDL